MKTEFKLVQIHRLNDGDIGGSVEHAPEEKVDCLIDMTKEQKEGLWKFVEGNWDEEKIAIVRHDGYYPDSVTPINPIIEHVRLAL